MWWILDLGLPGLDGFEVIRRLREKGSTVPIIVLSSRTDERGKVEALDLGADDYLTKPFGVDELHARVRAALRHRLQQQGERQVFRSGDLRSISYAGLVSVRGEELQALATRVRHPTAAGRPCRQGADPPLHPARGLGRGRPMCSISGSTSARCARRSSPSLERPRHILTETGVGYRLRAPGLGHRRGAEPGLILLLPSYPISLSLRQASRLAEGNRAQACAAVAELARGNLDHLTAGKGLGQHLIGLGVLRILEGGHDHPAIGEIKAGIRRKAATAGPPRPGWSEAARSR